jgi:hypothetical protein
MDGVLAALARLVLVYFLLGCSRGVDERTVADLLPGELAGVSLAKESFTGEEWLEARPEFSSPYFVARGSGRRSDISQSCG